MLLTLAGERSDNVLLAEMRRLVAADPDLAARVLTDLVIIGSAMLNRVHEGGGPTRDELLQECGLGLVEAEHDGPTEAMRSLYPYGWFGSVGIRATQGIAPA